MKGRILTCVYCGHEYPQETPPYGDDELTDHIRICPKHPLRKAEADFALVRNALVGWIGADGREELEKMEACIRDEICREDDRARSLNAIHALLKTLPTT